MRLIRLTSNKTTGFFDNSFNEDIIIEPNSQVCLSNITAEIPSNELTIDATNDTISYQLQNYNADLNSGGLREVELLRGKYGGDDKSTDTLIADIQERLNKSMTSMMSNDTTEIRGAGSKSVGGMWRFKKKDDTVKEKTIVDMEYQIKQMSNITSTTLDSFGWKKENVALTGAGITGRDGGTFNTFDSYMYNSNYLAMGGGCFRCRIHNLIDSTSASLSDDQLGIAILFTNKEPSTWIDGIDPDEYGYENIVCGVQVSKSTSEYGVINSAGWDNTTTGITPNTFTGGSSFGSNDVLQVGMNFGKIGVQILQDDGAGGTEVSEVFVPFDAPDTTKLYPIIFFLAAGATGATADSGACRLAVMSYSDNPYDFPKTNSADHDLGAVQKGQEQSSNGSNSFFNWATEKLSAHLGYNYIYYPPPSPSTQTFFTTLSFPSERQLISDQSKNDNYIIELMNLKLQSYDGYSDNVNNIRSGMKSILATIPADQNSDDVVRFNATTPYFLNLDNKDSVSLRNIQARILNLDYSPVSTVGLCIITLLIRDARDRQY